MKVRKVGATMTLSAAVAAAFAAFATPPTADASCASFWGIGNSAQCKSTFGGIAISLGDGPATSVGIGAAIALGDHASAYSDGFLNVALAAGKNTSATAGGVGNIAADIGNNTYQGSGRAVATGWFNKAINLGGGDNTAIVTSSTNPNLHSSNLGNNTVINIGTGNKGVVKDSFSTGVYQVGNRNNGEASGVLSNLVQIGNDNHGQSQNYSRQSISSLPNIAKGIFATNIVVGNRNEAKAEGNGVLSNIFGNDNEVKTKGDLDVTNVVGNGNEVKVRGNRNLTSLFGNGNKVTPKKYGGAGIKGDGNLTTILGNLNRVSARGNNNLTSVFGSRSKVRSFGNGNINSSLGDEKTSIKKSD
jgi:hypothetical protein